MPRRERAPAAPESTYRKLFEAAPRPMWLADAASSELLDANAAALRRCGWTRAELRRKTVADLQRVEGARGLARSAVAAGARKLLLLSARESAGEEAPAEARLRSLADRYLRIADQASFGILQLAADGRTAYANRALLDLLQVDRLEDLIGRGIEEFAAEGSRGLLRAELAKRRKKVASSYEVEIVGRRGGRRRVAVSCAPLLGPDGAFEGTVGALFDVTGWRSTEDALARQSQILDVVIRSMSDGVVVADERGRFILYNPAAEEIAGVGAIESDPERWQRDYGIFHPDGKTPYETADLPLVRAIRGEATDQVELFLRNPKRPDGVRVSISGRPLRDARGRARGGVVVFRDITEQRQLEEQMRRAHKMDAIGRLGAGIAHDFGTITTAIRCYARAIASDAAAGPPSPLREDAERIVAACDHALSLSRRFIEFSRGRPGAPTLLDLNEVVRGAEPLLRTVIGRGIDLRVSSRAPRATVRANRGELEQVILNLVANARDAMPEGGKLTLETGSVELDEAEARGLGLAGAASCVRLAVTDTGIGMEPEVQAKVFEPYFTTKAEGTGLGLFTAYGILRRAGGHISVRTAPGRGSTFTVLLPAAAEARGANPGPRRRGGRGAKRPRKPKPGARRRTAGHDERG